MARELEYRVGFAVDDRTLSELHARAFAHPDQPAPISVQPWAARLERHSLAWVGAFHDDNLVGFVHACWDGGLHAFLLDIVVDPRQRRSSIGSELVRRLTDEVRQAGCEWLHVDYLPHLEPFYRSCGFRSTPAGLIQLAE